MRKIVNDSIKKLSDKILIRRGFMSGIGWAFGVTIGFVMVSTLLVFILNAFGGLPLIGKWIADIVEVTQDQLLRRTPLVR